MHVVARLFIGGKGCTCMTVLKCIDLPRYAVTNHMLRPAKAMVELRYNLFLSSMLS